MPVRKIAEWGWAMVPFALIVGVILYLQASFEAVKETQRTLTIKQEATRELQFAAEAKLITDLAERIDRRIDEVAATKTGKP